MKEERQPGAHCRFYLDTDQWCRRQGTWRPVDIPMRADEWFCKQHARRIALREGSYGIYRAGLAVEELPLTAASRA